LANLDSCTQDDIQQAARNLVGIYPDDVEDTLGNELVQFADFSKTLFKGEKSDDMGFKQFVYKLLLDKQLKDYFPNVEVFRKYTLF